jgi:hypothetical protein
VFLSYKSANRLTLRRLALFFHDNYMLLIDFNLHRYQDATAAVIANCMIDKMRIDEITSMLHLLPGVLRVQRVEDERVVVRTPRFVFYLLCFVRCTYSLAFAYRYLLSYRAALHNAGWF